MAASRRLTVESDFFWILLFLLALPVAFAVGLVAVIFMGLPK